MRRGDEYGGGRRERVLLFCFLAALTAVFTGCAAPPMREGPAGTGRKEAYPEMPRRSIRVALMAKGGHITITVDGARIESGGQTLYVQGRGVLRADSDRIVLQGGSIPLPVRIVSERPVDIDGVSYYGDLRITGGVIVNTIPLDVYLRGVLLSEVDEDWPLQALMAQAVVSRTFAVKRMEENAAREYDVDSTEKTQAYSYDPDVPSPHIEEAVRKTRGQVILYGGEPIEAFFHACSGGRTENCGDVFQEDLPYLRSVPDPYCRGKDRFSWEIRLSGGDIGRVARALLEEGDGSVLRGNGDAGSRVRDLRIGKRTASGRVKEFHVDFEGGTTIALRANSFRLRVGPKELKSLSIRSIVREQEGDALAFTLHGEGYGHGVGMSQWGAFEMARLGFDYRKIITYYYRGVSIAGLW